MRATAVSSRSIPPLCGCPARRLSASSCACLMACACLTGDRRGFNTLRALAQNRGETGSLETAPSATQSPRCSHSGIVQGQAWGFPWISGEFRRRGARSRDKAGGAGARRGAVSQRSSREPIFVVRVVHAETPSCGRRMVDRTSARPNAVARVSQPGGWIPAISLECPGSNF